MAAKKKPDESDLTSLSSDDESIPKPRLNSLYIKNFRSVGSDGITIDLDDIVVLVGPNNAGKSSILRAYEIVMKHGSKECQLSINDFPNGIVEPDNLPEIHLETVVYDNSPGEQWIDNVKGEQIVKERWIWSSPNKDPKREGWNVTKGGWDDKVPWGAPNVANSRRPQPHRIDAFAAPEIQATEIAKILSELLKDRIKTIKSDESQSKTDYEIIIDKIRDFQIAITTSAADEIRVIEEEITKYIEQVFPKHRIQLDSKAESDIEKTFTPFKGAPEILMGTSGGYFGKIENQGSGARRTLLWSTLKYVSERNESSEGVRPHVLLLDEPEICLHPSAVREARDVLYGLPKNSNWQVMITTHSPVFIDLSKDNTTIIRVSRGESKIECTTIFRPKTAKLDDNDKRNMKLLNICDPYLHEFFFGGQQIIVEGDTEYTAFSKIREKHPAKYSNVQIIRARGKGIIPSVAKVLKQFSKSFSILHDSDAELTPKGKRNPAWTMNDNILSIRGSDPGDTAIQIIACKTCFETAIFGEDATEDKPYNAIQKIDSDPEIESKVQKLLDSLLDPSNQPPENCIRWKQKTDLL
jgi:putative ATP-dependent endonuclease of OLD family